MSGYTKRAIDRVAGALAAKITPMVCTTLAPTVLDGMNKLKENLNIDVEHKLAAAISKVDSDRHQLIDAINAAIDTAIRESVTAVQQEAMAQIKQFVQHSAREQIRLASKTADHGDIAWFHSIDLGDRSVTAGFKSTEALEQEFGRLQLSQATLAGKRLLDIGCNDGYFSLRCATLGAQVTAIDGIYSDGLKYVRHHLHPKFHFYCMDMLSPSFVELGHFDVILYLGVLYHTMFPFEHLARLAAACAPHATIFIETEFYNLPGCENDATIFFDYDLKLSPDGTSPVFPSIRWIEQTLARLGFHEVTELHRLGEHRGRVTLRARYGDASGERRPTLFAAQQI